MISRAMVFESAMSVPTSMPSHRSPHSADSVRRGIDHDHLGSVVDALEDVVEEDRMRRARVRPPQQDEIGVLDLLV